ncbi:MAG: hypothetical protein ABI601_06665 [bacterium]
MPRKSGKRDATKRPAAKAKRAKKAKTAAKSPGTKSVSTNAQLDAEADYFHRTLRENAQLGRDIVLGPGETHTSTPDSRGQAAIIRKRFSAR